MLAWYSSPRRGGGTGAYATSVRAVFRGVVRSPPKFFSRAVRACDCVAADSARSAGISGARGACNCFRALLPCALHPDSASARSSQAAQHVRAGRRMLPLSRRRALPSSPVLFVCKAVAGRRRAGASGERRRYNRFGFVCRACDVGESGATAMPPVSERPEQYVVGAGSSGGRGTGRGVCVSANRAGAAGTCAGLAPPQKFQFFCR